MGRLLVVLTLCSLVLARSGAAVTATAPLVTLSVTGGRALCSLDAHRAQPCSPRYGLRRGHTVTVRARTERGGHRAHAAEARIAISFTDGRALCSIGGHRTECAASPAFGPGGLIDQREPTRIAPGLPTELPAGRAITSASCVRPRATASGAL